MTPFHPAPQEGKAKVVLRLYIAGDGPNSARAKANLQNLQRRQLAGCAIEIIDILEDPLRSLNDGIRLSPTLMRVFPEPQVYIVGDLRDASQLLGLLGIPEEEDHGR